MAELLVDSTAEQNFTENFETFMALADSDEHSIIMSERDYMGETIDLIPVVKRDYADLIQGRLKPHFPDSLKSRLDCFVVAHSQLSALEDQESRAKVEWDETAPDVKNLKNHIIHDTRFLMEELGEKDKAKYLTKIAIGTGRRDLCMDCMELGLFGDKNRPVLESNGIDMENYRQIKQHYDRLSLLLQELNEVPVEVKEARAVLRKAYSWLHEATSEIRKYGQHIFWQDEVKLQDYKSDHHQGLKS